MYLTAKPGLNLYEATHNLYNIPLSVIMYFAVQVLACLITGCCPKITVLLETLSGVCCNIWSHAQFHPSKIQKFLNSKAYLMSRFSDKGLQTRSQLSYLEINRYRLKLIKK